MDHAVDRAGESEDDVQLLSSAQTELVWSIGDRCLAQWSGDGKLYTGVIRKLRHAASGCVIALVRFNDYDSDDSEEVDVRQLQRVVKKTDRKRGEKPVGAEGPDKQEDGSKWSTGLFQPFTGSEYFTRLEDKYGHESDSADDETSPTNDWISPTPYETKGKVSQWKIRSPAKSQLPLSQRRKPPVAQVGSPKKKTSVGGKASGCEVQNHGNLQDQTPPNKRESTPRHACSATSSDRIAAGLSSESSEELGTSMAGNYRNQEDCSPTPPVAVSEERGFEGFDEDDMEKPKFSFSAPSEKVPFCLGNTEDVQIPAPLNQYLRDYQREGVQFLYSHYTHMRGAILGDDMGLGKTVQVIGFLSALMGKQGNRQDVMRQKPRFIRLLSDTPDLHEDKKDGPFLIIGPGSVLYNWLEELDTWGYFSVRKYHGAGKASCLLDVQRGKVEVVVTTFETCRDNVAELNKVKWDAVIVDEVHRIKGLKAQTTIALRSLKCVRRYGLTGTALQNNMTELWCLLDWAQPGVLGSAEDFAEDFVHPIELGQKHNATKRELAVARKKKEEFAAVRSQMLLRRAKKLIADQLPVKTDRVVFCRLSPLQISVYKAVLDHPDMQAVLNANKKCVCGSGLTQSKCCFKKLKSGRSTSSVMFTFMHVLLKTSNHAALLVPHAKMTPRQEKEAKKLCSVAFKDHPEFLELARDAAFRTLSDPKYCGKMKVLHGMLSVFAKAHSKVLVFSYSTRLLDILEQHIMSEGHEYRRIDGSVMGRRRQEIVREFNSDPSIFLCLVSTKAGGLGLNMTGANKVVIFDPNWNPSHDLQAQDRAYRIGQIRDVEVYRLISAGSIEENIYLRQIYKQQLDNVAVATENARRYFQGIQGDAGNKGELFGINNMFQLRTGDSCLTMEILDRNAKVESGVAGYETAAYIPSRQEELGSQDTEEDSDDEKNDDRGSSDEETLKTFKDLFAVVSDEEEEERQLTTPTKHRRVHHQDPKPSTSGLHSSNKNSPARFRNTNHHDSSGSDSSMDISITPSSRHTTRQRRRGGATSGGQGETNVGGVLDFLDEYESSASKKGKSPLKRTLKRGERGEGASDHEETDTIAVLDLLGDGEESSRKGKSARRRNLTGEEGERTTGRQTNSTVLLDVLDDEEESRSRKGKLMMNRREGEEEIPHRETSSTAVLDFLEDEEESRIRKGKLPWTKRGERTTQGEANSTALLDFSEEEEEGRHRKVKGSRTGDGGRGGVWEKRGSNKRKVVTVPDPVEDSLVTPTFTSVSSVFEQYGVVHVHENPRVVGASRVEDHITRHAMRDVFELSTNTQAPALLCDPMSQPSEEEDQSAGKKPTSGRKAARGTGARGRTPAMDHNSARTVEHRRWRILVGQTPTAIRKKQWTLLKETTKTQDEVTLAQRVLVASPEERLAMLKELYCSRHDAALHDVLGDILTKPPEPTASVDTTSKAKPAQTPSIKGERKTSQAKGSPARRQRPRRKRVAPGLLYDDLDDTQPSQRSKKPTHHLDDDLSSDSSGFDIGASVSPAKVKATPKKRRGARNVHSSRTQLSVASTVLMNMDEGEAHVSKQRVTQKPADRMSDEDSTFVPTEDVDGLLKELGGRCTEAETDQQRATRTRRIIIKPPPSGSKTRCAGESSRSPGSKTKFSVLDDIFSDPDDCEKKKRKPPPSRKIKLNSEKFDSRNQGGVNRSPIPSTSGFGGGTKSPGSNKERRSSSTNSPDLFSDLMNNSTLRDDGVDCFGEPSQWKKRHKTQTSPTKKVDMMFQEATDSYLQLFETGHLVKKKQREKGGGLDCEKPAERGAVRMRVKRSESSDVDPSGSLFSSISLELNNDSNCNNQQ